LNNNIEINYEDFIPEERRLKTPCNKIIGWKTPELKISFYRPDISKIYFYCRYVCGKYDICDEFSKMVLKAVLNE